MDYRFMPEPDLPPLVLTEEFVRRAWCSWDPTTSLTEGNDKRLLGVIFRIRYDRLLNIAPSFVQIESLVLPVLPHELVNMLQESHGSCRGPFLA
jgi:hypothetical protein